MMVLVKNVQFGQKLSDWRRKPSLWRVRVFAKIRMMDESPAMNFQLAAQFAQVFFYDFTLKVHEYVETEDEIDRLVGKH